MDKVQKFKKYITSIVQMDDKAFDLCLDYLQVLKIEKGDYFVEEGKVCKKIAFINSGIFRIFYLKDGIEVNTCFCEEISIVSSFGSFVNQTPSKENIQSLEDAEIVTLSYENMAKLYKTSEKWRSVKNLLTEKECLRLSNRVESLSFETAKEKYEKLITTHPKIIQRVSIQDIASYIGVSRETLSRIRSKIEL